MPETQKQSKDKQRFEAAKELLLQGLKKDFSYADNPPFFIQIAKREGATMEIILSHPGVLRIYSPPREPQGHTRGPSPNFEYNGPEAISLYQGLSKRVERIMADHRAKERRAYTRRESRKSATLDRALGIR